MSRPDSERIARTTKEELRDLLRGIEVPPFTPGQIRDPYRRDISRSEPLQQEQRVQLERLCQEEQEVAHNLINHFHCRYFDPNNPVHPPREDVAGCDAALLSPDFTDEIHKWLLSVHLAHLARGVDSLAYNKIPLSTPPARLCSMEIPRHAREFLDEFFRRFHSPSAAEAQLLSRALGIDRQVFDTFRE